MVFDAIIFLYIILLEYFFSSTTIKYYSLSFPVIALGLGEVQLLHLFLIMKGSEFSMIE